MFLFWIFIGALFIYVYRKSLKFGFDVCGIAIRMMYGLLVIAGVFTGMFMLFFLHLLTASAFVVYLIQ